jgi:hypothetical protein
LFGQHTFCERRTLPSYFGYIEGGDFYIRVLLRHRFDHMSFVYTPYSFDMYEMYLLLFEYVCRLRDICSVQFTHGVLRSTEAHNVEPQSDWRFLPQEGRVDITWEVDREIVAENNTSGIRQTEAQRRVNIRMLSNYSRVYPSSDTNTNRRGLAPHQMANYYQSGQTQ